MRALMCAAMFFSCSFSVSAECWLVKDMKGQTSISDNYRNFVKDGFSGTFMISVDGDKASVRYSGSDAGGAILWSHLAKHHCWGQ